MLESVRVRPCSGAVLRFGPDTEALVGIRESGSLTLRHGNRRDVVEARRDPSVPAGEIRLPGRVLEDLLVVPGIPYDLRWEGTELRLGPVIAVIIPQRYLVRPRFERWEDWAGAYPRVRGLLFVTSAASLDLDQGRAGGYYFRPGRGGGRWVRGRFPLPDVAYRRAGLPSRMYRELATLGVRLFDSECVDKWRVYRWLSARPEVAPHLPWTTPVERVERVPELARSHRRLVLKRRAGLQGRGFLVLWTGAGGGFWVQRRDDPKPRHLPGDEELIKFLRPVLGRYRYLAQQPVDLPAYRGRLMDLRVIMQRDEWGEWQCTGGAARFGRPGHVASNFVWEGGFGSSPVNGLSLALDLDRRAARALWKEVQAVALRICQALDGRGEFADLGLDMAVDRRGRIWLLEVNCSLQVHELAIFGGGPEAVRRARQMPLLYARFLAGFPPADWQAPGTLSGPGPDTPAP